MRESAPRLSDEGGRWRFGLFVFDARALELWKSGRAVKVRPQSLKLLALLVARRGELVSRADLQRDIWGTETFVDYEQGVNHCIKELRAALGDDPKSPCYIETLARRGYRFIAPVERIGPVTAPSVQPILPAPRLLTADVDDVVAVNSTGLAARSVASSPRGWTAVVAVAVLIGVASAVLYIKRPGAPETTRLSTITVLPFESDAADAALGIGLSSAIARRLSGQQAIVVRRARTGELPASESAKNASAIPAATLALEGRITTTGAEVTVLARLRPTSDTREVWSEQFRVRRDQLFSVEDVIAEHIVSALGLQLAAAEQERLRRRYTSNTAAYTEYLRGRAALVRYTHDATREAIAAFERALHRDPRYALARAGLAMACADMCLRFASAADVDQWAERAEAEARAALDLDPDLAEAHLARAAVARKREFDWNATMAESRRALLLNPNLDQARFFMAAAYYHLGYMEEALIEVEKGRALSGEDIVEPARIEALVALFSGNFAPALAHLEDVSRLSSQAIGDTYLALAAYYSGSIERGRTMLESLATHPSAATATRSRAALASILSAQGQRESARAELDRVLAGAYRDHHVTYSVGVAYAQLGDTAHAMQWLRTAADTGFPCLPWFERDPLLEPLRRLPQFAALLNYVRARRETALSVKY